MTRQTRIGLGAASFHQNAALTPFLHYVTKIRWLVVNRVLNPSSSPVNSEFMFPALHP